MPRGLDSVLGALPVGQTGASAAAVRLRENGQHQHGCGQFGCQAVHARHCESLDHGCDRRLADDHRCSGCSKAPLPVRPRNRWSMKFMQILAILPVVLLPPAGFAQNSPTKAEPAKTARRMPPPGIRPLVILRQDLFDRNGPNNLRSDYPAPPRQPAQF